MFMHKCFRKLHGAGPQDENSVAGWTSGLLFGAAINALGTAVRSETITPDLVRQEIWSLKQETLDATARSQLARWM
jgi:hypothetical protein